MAAPGASIDAPSYGGGQPPPAPGAGGVGIKRGGRATSSSGPMEVSDSYYYGGPPPPPSAGAVAAQIATSMLQQTAMVQHAAQCSMTDAQIAGILHAHRTEAQKRIIPEEIQPVHHNTLKPILKKVRVVQPVTHAPPPPIVQVMNVDFANAGGAAIAHARSGGDASTFMGRLLDQTTSARTAASGVLRKLVSKPSWPPPLQPSLHLRAQPQRAWRSPRQRHPSNRPEPPQRDPPPPLHHLQWSNP